MGVRAGFPWSVAEHIGTPVYGKDFDAADTRRALAEATRERMSEWSARTS